MKHTLLPLTEFTARREKLFAQMTDNSVALFIANNEVTRSNDTEYLFCQDKDFYYLTGFNEPDAILMMVKGEQNKVVLFCRAKDPFQEVWHGRRVGPENAKKEYGFDESYALEEADAQITESLGNKNTLYYLQGKSERHEQQVYQWRNSVIAKSRQGIAAPEILVNVAPIVHDMRLMKSPSELALMRTVNHISGKAHTRAMEKTQAGAFEYQIEAELLHEFARHGARHAAYNSIVAGGDNANILHYNDNCDILNDGDLLLIDAGGELAGYAADITRTFPISGKFTEPQKAIYQLVLDAQQAAIQAIKPGTDLALLNQLVCEKLTDGLLTLGILEGEKTALLESKACKKYFIHGLGHWLGLDVHDVGDYHVNESREQKRTFEPGMVMTIEPGLYFPSDDENIEEKWRGIAVRIEDNILVTDQGHENLTTNAPKSIEEIETLMAGN